MKTSRISNSLALLALLAWMALSTQGALAASQKVTDNLGQTTSGSFSLSSLGNATAIIYMGYSRCAASCPMALRSLDRALNALEPEARRCFRPVFVDISDVDPANSPAQRRQYAQKFLDSYLAGGVAAVPGTTEQRNRIIASLGEKVTTITDRDPSVADGYSHSRMFSFVSNAGAIRKAVPLSAGYEILVDSLQQIAHSPDCKSPTRIMGASQK